MRQLIQYSNGERRVIDTKTMTASAFLTVGEADAPLTGYELNYSIELQDVGGSKVLREHDQRFSVQMSHEPFDGTYGVSIYFDGRPVAACAMDMHGKRFTVAGRQYVARVSTVVSPAECYIEKVAGVDSCSEQYFERFRGTVPLPAKPAVDAWWTQYGL